MAFSVADYRVGLAALGPALTARERAILRLQHAAPDHALNVHHFANQLGCSYQRLNVDYGTLARKMVEAIGQPWERSKGWWPALSTGWNSRQGFVWQLHPALVRALEETALVAPAAAE